MNDLIAEALLQSLQCGDDFFAGSIAARPQPQLTSARTLEDGQLYPQLGDGCARLPFLDPRTDQAEELGSAAERMTDDGLAHFRICSLPAARVD